MAPYLSKSRIQSGRQCHKRLWLELHEPNARIWSETAQARLDDGTRFGELARELLGSGKLIAADHLHVVEALEETQDALKGSRAEIPMLFEPAFSHEGVRVRVDAFERGEHGDTLIEVKSTASVKDEYLWDCAIQTWVARGAGRSVTAIKLALVNTRFVYKAHGDYSGLLKLVDITTAVEKYQPAIAGIVAELKAACGGSQPDIQTGSHCSTPYDCPFLARCRAAEAPPAEYPVEILPRATPLVNRLHADGYRDIRDVPEEKLSNQLHKTIAAATRNAKPHVAESLRSLIACIPYPRYFLDFETVSFIIPQWQGTRPFEPLPFQFSCHLESVDGVVEHAEFLDTTGDLPLAAFVDHLLQAVRVEGPILVWNQSFEASRLRELAAKFPARRTALLSVVSRLIDLLPIFRAHYYHRDMRGSWSLKAVLPTIAPDLAYSDLEVSDGSLAQIAYRRAIDPKISNDRKEQLIKSLLDYCKRDTYSMVRLAKWAAEGMALPE